MNKKCMGEGPVYEEDQVKKQKKINDWWMEELSIRIYD